MSDPIKNRYDFVYYFDVERGNPNGDPDAGNMPRVDAETGRGLVTDVCLKRKIRNYVQAAHENEPGFEMYIRRGVTLNSNDRRALEEQNLNTAEMAKEAKKTNPNIETNIVNFMCRTFYDVRTFGAVMTTFNKPKENGLNCGQIRGPVQLTFAQSVDPVIPQEISITRVAITRDEDANKPAEMGNKYIIPYALYRCEGFVSANLARKTTGFSDYDLEVLWDALENMFDFDRSAARGLMSPRYLIVFKHSSELGNAPANRLFDAVTVAKKEGVSAPRSFSDYNGIKIDKSQIPSSIKVERKFGKFDES